MKLQFLGAAQTVTGSKYLVSVNGSRLLVDCGLYQGIKNLRERNWRDLPVDPRELDAVVLTHAHIDHSGYLPGLYRNGYRGPVYCSSATLQLCKILLPDAGYLQEEDARYASRKRFSKHANPEPLFTIEDAERVLQQFRPLDYHEPHSVAKGVDATLRPAGHILGACSVMLNDGKRKLTFSGDVGRQHDLIMHPPEKLHPTDYLVVESTYGDRVHEKIDPMEQLASIINDTIHRGGVVLVPAFAVGRAQLLLHMLATLRAHNKISPVPVYLNSPMAIKSTELFCKFHREHRLSVDACEMIDDMTTFVRTVDESIGLVKQKYPSIIISASGMASGGRVLHHMKALIGDHRNSVVFAGFQAPGTRGAALVSGADKIKIHGAYLPVRAQIHDLGALSAHADSDELIAWMGSLDEPPRQTFITHGEPASADMMRVRIRDELGWACRVPEYLDEVLLD